jgi:hypothetical protein
MAKRRLASVHDAAISSGTRSKLQHVTTWFTGSVDYHGVWLQVWRRWRCELRECIWQHFLQPLICVPWKAGPQLCKVHLGSYITRGALLISYAVETKIMHERLWRLGQQACRGNSSSSTAD